MSYAADPDDVPEPRLSIEDENEPRRVGSFVQRLQAQMSGSPVIGTAIEHSIEDPFTGEISVRFLLA